MASMPASTTLAGVSKSGSPISRWTMSLPCASRARARASVSNAVSTPRPAMRLASRSCVCGVTSGLIVLFVLFVDCLFLALRSLHMRHGIRDTPRGLLEVPDLQIAQQAQGQHLSAED